MKKHFTSLASFLARIRIRQPLLLPLLVLAILIGFGELCSAQPSPFEQGRSSFRKKKRVARRAEKHSGYVLIERVNLPSETKYYAANLEAEFLLGLGTLRSKELIKRLCVPVAEWELFNGKWRFRFGDIKGRRKTVFAIPILVKVDAVLEVDSCDSADASSVSFVSPDTVGGYVYNYAISNDVDTVAMDPNASIVKATIAGTDYQFSTPVSRHATGFLSFASPYLPDGYTSNLPWGEQKEIILTMSDSSTVEVMAFVPGNVPSTQAQPTLTCPADYEIVADPGSCAASLCYFEPTATADPGTVPASIPGFSTMEYWDHHWYAVSDAKHNYQDALALANTYGGHLLSLEDEIEAEFIVSLTTDECWTAFNDEAAEGQFEWSTGEASCFAETIWAPNEPSNSPPYEDAVVFNTVVPSAQGKPGFINDVPAQDNSFLARVILEYDRIPFRIAGPTTGSTFSTTNSPYDIQYAVAGANGLDSCSFQVRVKPLLAEFDYDQTGGVTEFINLTEGGMANYTWLWDLGDGNTSTLRDPVHTYASQDTFDVTLYATNSCGTDTVTHPVITTPVVSAPPSTFLQGQVTVFPNPTISEFSVRLRDLAGKSIDLSLNLPNGQLIWQRSLRLSGADETIPVDADDLSAGVYLLHLQADGQSSTHKVVIR